MFSMYLLCVYIIEHLFMYIYIYIRKRLLNPSVQLPLRPLRPGHSIDMIQWLMVGLVGSRTPWRRVLRPFSFSFHLRKRHVGQQNSCRMSGCPIMPHICNLLTHVLTQKGHLNQIYIYIYKSGDYHLRCRSFTGFS